MPSHFQMASRLTLEDCYMEEVMMDSVAANHQISTAVFDSWFELCAKMLCLVYRGAIMGYSSSAKMVLGGSTSTSRNPSLPLQGFCKMHTFPVLRETMQKPLMIRKALINRYFEMNYIINVGLHRTSNILHI